MKLYQVKHINKEHNENAVMGEEIVFVKSISSITGESMEPMRQPADWDNVQRLTHMLFLAWDNDNPVEGTVYFGQFKSVIS